MPATFKNLYLSSFCVIDASELRCEIPTSLSLSLSLQSQPYPGYKSHTMRQGFVAIALNSAFVFVSEVFSGAISDQQLAIESSFRELLDLATKGKGVMAERGFDIQGLLAKPNLLLNIPPFLGADLHLQKADVFCNTKDGSCSNPRGACHCASKTTLPFFQQCHAIDSEWQH